jgi:hypothetical protein
MHRPALFVTTLTEVDRRKAAEEIREGLGGTLFPGSGVGFHFGGIFSGWLTRPLTLTPADLARRVSAPEAEFSDGENVKARPATAQDLREDDIVVVRKIRFAEREKDLGFMPWIIRVGSDQPLHDHSIGAVLLECVKAGRYPAENRSPDLDRWWHRVGRCRKDYADRVAVLVDMDTPR